MKKEIYKNKKYLRQEYIEKKKSMREIADGLGVSLHAIVYWMEKHRIKTRHWSEATYVKRNPEGDPFQIKKNLSEDEKVLFFLAIGLFLGEGHKNGNPTRVALGNTDPLIIRVFLKFLRDICGVEQNKIRCEINIYDDVDLNVALEYWSRVVELPLSHFSKPIVRQARKGNYKRFSQYGTLTVGVNNARLVSIILGWCENYASMFAGVTNYLNIYDNRRDSLMAKRLHGKQKSESSILSPGSRFLGRVPLI